MNSALAKARERVTLKLLRSEVNAFIVVSKDLQLHTLHTLEHLSNSICRRFRGEVEKQTILHQLGKSSTLCLKSMKHSVNNICGEQWGYKAVVFKVYLCKRNPLWNFCVRKFQIMNQTASSFIITFSIAFLREDQFLVALRFLFLFADRFPQNYAKENLNEFILHI